MQSMVRVILSAALTAGLTAAGLGFTTYAQTTGTTISDPAGPVPDPTHVPFVLPKDIKWNGTYGVQQTAILYGDPSKPGPYTLVYRWFPGHFSQPHFHDQARWAYIVSGTWWVSTSNVYDERTTYPLHAGTFTIDVANTVHWDGARTGEKEPAVIVLSGIGPVKTIQVDQDGKPKPGQ
jgi:quercetin dioxygenase-like cupin family protein